MMPKIIRLSPPMIEDALEHLRSGDPIMGRLIEGVGPFALKPRRNRFHTLVKAIVSQQISTAAARSVLAKLEAACEPEGLSPEAISCLSPTRIRAAGLSKQKQAYLKDLALHVEQGLLRLERMGRIHDEEVIAELIAVKGIDATGVERSLIFTLGGLISSARHLAVRQRSSGQRIGRVYPTRCWPTKSPNRGDLTRPWPVGTAGAAWLYRQSFSGLKTASSRTAKPADAADAAPRRKRFHSDQSVRNRPMPMAYLFKGQARRQHVLQW